MPTINFIIKFKINNILIFLGYEQHESINNIEIDTINFLKYLIEQDVNGFWQNWCYNCEIKKQSNHDYILTINHDCTINNDLQFFNKSELYDQIKKQVNSVVKKYIKVYEFIDWAK